MISGEPLRATTIRSGKSACSTAMPKVPSTWLERRPAPCPRGCRPRTGRSGGASTSVSVSETSSTPSAASCSRSVAALSMIPLWTTATAPSASRCGWALTSVAAPWVAQRVWPMPSLPANRLGSAASRSRTRPGLLGDLEPAGAQDRDSRPSRSRGTPAGRGPRRSAGRPAGRRRSRRFHTYEVSFSSFASSRTADAPELALRQRGSGHHAAGPARRRSGGRSRGFFMP